MKAFIGTYFKTAEQALMAFDKLSDEVKKNKVMCQLHGSYFIVGKSTRKAFNKK
jgi:hypothetical protein